MSNGNSIQHKVLPGETLNGIARQHGVTADDILAINPQITDRNKIFAGDTILIPSTEAPVTPDIPAPVTPIVPAPPPPPTGNLLHGLDAAQRISSSVARCFKDQGKDFVIRYYNVKNSNLLPTKRLIRSEAETLVKAGLLIGVVFQQQGKPASNFDRDKGILHGKVAHDRAANEINQPGGSTIYFGVDFDATQSEVETVIKDYFKGVRQGLAEANGGAPKYEIGVYGSGLVCSKLLEAGLATFTWLSQSRLHTGSEDFANQKRFNIHQLFGKSVIVCGIDTDKDETNPAKPSGLFTIAVA
jgi:LysM repeat protein